MLLCICMFGIRSANSYGSFLVRLWILFSNCGVVVVWLVMIRIRVGFIG